MLRTVPGVGLYFCSLNCLQTHFCAASQPTALQAIIFGITGRTFVGAVFIPITVVKTRFESGVFHYKSISEAVKLTYLNEGARGLSSGLLPTLLRDAPFSGLYFMFYSQLKKLIIPNNSGVTTHSSTPFSVFFCGLNAGLLASFITHPADVIKTKMQLYPKSSKSFTSTTLSIFKEKGVQGFFSGLAPRMIRRTLMSAMAWTVYEQIMKNLGLK